MTFLRFFFFSDRTLPPAVRYSVVMPFTFLDVRMPDASYVYVFTHCSFSFFFCFVIYKVSCKDPDICHVSITAAPARNLSCILEFSETVFPHWVLLFSDILSHMCSYIWRISCLVFLVFVMLRLLYSHFHRLSIAISHIFRNCWRVSGRMV